MHVTAYAINNGARDTFAAGQLRHDIAPDRTVGAAVVINNDHVSGRHIIDKIAHGAGRIAGGLVAYGIGKTHDSLPVVIKRHDAETLSAQSEFIERVRDACGIESFEQFEELLFSFAHTFSP